MINIETFYDLLQRLVQKDYDNFMDNPHNWKHVLEFEEGSKLIKIVAHTEMDDGEQAQRSAFGFIVKDDNSLKSTKGNFFKRGDLLKAATWNAPAKNFARGNIFLLDQNSKIRWTGIS